jgi:hypothetical protein
VVMNTRRHVSVRGTAVVLFAALTVSHWSEQAAAGDTFTTIGFAYNASLQTGGGFSFPGDPGYPSGNVTLGGVPFTIPTRGNNAYSSEVATGNGSGTATLIIPVNVADVDMVHTLINTIWGQSGPNSYLSLTFNGTGGATYTDNLVGNINVRDYNDDGFTDTINGTSTINVVSLEGGQHRLDEQNIVLPASFQDQILTSITLTDSGNENFQRAILAGLTVQSAVSSVPEPSTLLTSVIGAGLLLAYSAYRRSRSGLPPKVA